MAFVIGASYRDADLTVSEGRTYPPGPWFTIPNLPVPPGVTICGVNGEISGEYAHVPQAAHPAQIAKFSLDLTQPLGACPKPNLGQLPKSFDSTVFESSDPGYSVSVTSPLKAYSGDGGPAYAIGLSIVNRAPLDPLDLGTTNASYSMGVLGGIWLLTDQGYLASPQELLSGGSVRCKAQYYSASVGPGLTDQWTLCFKQSLTIGKPIAVLVSSERGAWGLAAVS